MNNPPGKRSKVFPYLLLATAVLIAGWIGIRALVNGGSAEFPSATVSPTAGQDPMTLYLMKAPGMGCQESAQEVIQALVGDIRNASKSIHLAIYSFSLNSVGDALLAAEKRGIPVELVMESDNMDGSLVKRLQEGGIPIRGDKVKSLMHDKFMVIDGQVVWTGSMNLTPTSLCEDLNNLVRVEDASLASRYLDEFDEMFEQGLFSWKSPKDDQFIPAVIDSRSLGAYFSPEDHVQEQLLDMIGIAQSEIRFFGYSFTADPLAEAMIDKDRQGVSVKGLMDAVQAYNNIGTDYDRFRQAGLDVRLASTSGAMHHKVIIIDQQVVIVGSYNYTKSADENNDENILVIHSPELAEEFLAEFDRVFATAKP